MAEPGTPMRSHRNNYEFDKANPRYVMVRYPTREETSTNQRVARAAITRSLVQVRGQGRDAFPGSVQYVVVTLVSMPLARKDPAHWGRAHYCGAIFSVDDVFDASVSLEELSRSASLSSTPFRHDPETGEREWVIIGEHHPRG
jgi:hypothetical protein